MSLDNVKIDIGTPIFDFENYTFSEVISEPKFEEIEKDDYVFPITTCIESNLIVLSEIS